MAVRSGGRGRHISESAWSTDLVPVQPELHREIVCVGGGVPEKVLIDSGGPFPHPLTSHVARAPGGSGWPGQKWVYLINPHYVGRGELGSLSQEDTCKNGEVCRVVVIRVLP